MANANNNIISLVAKDPEIQAQIEKALLDFQKIGQIGGTIAQADLCPQLISHNITKDKVIYTMRDTLREQEAELEAYQKTLGRKLTEKEINDFVTTHSTPALFEARDNKILARLNRNLAQCKELTRK
jgi:hypothetical protein